MPTRKHAIEIYKNYTIYIVSGIKPTMFIAEKADPSKGATLVDDDLDKLKSNIDKTLDYALSVRINVLRIVCRNRMPMQNNKQRQK